MICRGVEWIHSTYVPSSRHFQNSGNDTWVLRPFRVSTIVSYQRSTTYQLGKHAQLGSDWRRYHYFDHSLGQSIALPALPHVAYVIIIITALQADRHFCESQASSRSPLPTGAVLSLGFSQGDGEWPGASSCLASL